MRLSRRTSEILVNGVSLILALVLYVAPFIFVILSASMTSGEAGLFHFALPKNFLLWENIRKVVVFDHLRMLRALANSAVITAGTVVLEVVFGALVAVILQRRNDRVATVASAIMLSGLIIPPAVVPTVFLLQRLHLYGSLTGMVIVDIAFNVPFVVLILRAFVGTIPRELDEAAIVEGSSPFRVFAQVLFPLLQPAIMTVVITQIVTVFNDFVGPLYFLPGTKHVTAPLTLFTYMGQFGSQWNLVFADVVVVVILPLIAFIFFQKQLVAGITGGAIKG